MLELLAIFGLLVVALFFAAAIAVVGLILKLSLKILFLPLALLFGLLKLIFLGVLLVVGLALAPLVLAGVILLAVAVIPLFLLFGALGLGWSLA